MAKKIITSCDKCGEAGEDVKTYTVRTSDQAWQVDLDDRHAKPLFALLEVGRPVSEAGPRRSTNGMDRYIRGVPSQA